MYARFVDNFLNVRTQSGHVFYSTASKPVPPRLVIDGYFILFLTLFCTHVASSRTTTNTRRFVESPLLYGARAAVTAIVRRAISTAFISSIRPPVRRLGRKRERNIITGVRSRSRIS